jgi:hypothetical protein
MISRRCKKTGVAHACAQTFFHKQKPVALVAPETKHAL